MFYGHILNMSTEEILGTRVAQMIDLINCLSVYNGQAELKKTKTISIDDI